MKNITAWRLCGSPGG